jgi:hypothetical protein
VSVESKFDTHLRVDVTIRRGRSVEIDDRDRSIETLDLKLKFCSEGVVDIRKCRTRVDKSGDWR